jgi:rod shape-determining protein MreC
MENIITRHRNVSILVAVLFAQVLGLAVQVKRANTTAETRLIQLWTVSAITPFEKVLVWVQKSTSNVWHNYVYLRGLRAENRGLKEQIEQMRLEQVRLSEDAEQARRLKVLLGFKEKFILKTVAAQVIGSSGSEQSRAVYIDKGMRDGVRPDQAVITADGIVGKVLRAFDSSALVLLVNDQTSGVGVVLEKTRVQGVLRGTATGEVAVEKIMSDESVQPGERVLTSGGDQIFSKGLYVGTITKIARGSDSFLDVRVKPGASLSKLEEVLVVTQVETRSPVPGDQSRPVRAVDVLTQRLPSVPDKPATGTNTATGATAISATPKPAGSSASQQATGTVTVGGSSAPQVATPKPAVSGTPQSVGQDVSKQSPTVQAPMLNAPSAASVAAPKKPVTEPAKPGASQTVAPKVSPSPPNSAPHSAAQAGASNGTTKAPIATGSAIGQGTVKPAVLPKQPAKTADQSAKPQTAPVEDKPE